MRLAKHVALPNDTGGDADAIDAAVELGMRGRHEHFLKPPSIVPNASGRMQPAGVSRQEHLFLCSLGRLDVNNKRQLVHELVGGRSRAIGTKAAQLVDHSSGRACPKPDVAVGDPDDISFGLAISATYIPDLGVRPQVVDMPICAVQQRVVLLDQDLRVKAWEVCGNLLENRIRRIIDGCDTKVDSQLCLWIGEPERRREAFVKSCLETLDGPNYRDVRDFIFFQGRGNGLRVRCRVVAVAGAVSVSNSGMSANRQAQYSL